MRQEVD